MARAFVSVVLKNPCSASKLKQEFMENVAKYNLVFNSTITIKVWPVLAKLILKIVKCQKLNRKNKDLIPMNSNKINMCFLSFFCVSSIFKKFSYNINDLLSLDVDAIIEEMIAKQVEMIKEFKKEKAITKNMKMANVKNGNELLEIFKKQEGIQDNHLFKINKILDDDYEISEEIEEEIRSRFLKYQKDGLDANECFYLLAKKFGFDAKVIRTVLFER